MFTTCVGLHGPVDRAEDTVGVVLYDVSYGIDSQVSACTAARTFLS
jgi:hypothetical protein